MHIGIPFGIEVGNADGLSCLPRAVKTSSDRVPEDLINHLASTTETAEHIKEWTSRDPVLSQVQQYS